MNYTQETFEKFTKKAKQHDSSAERKDKKQSYDHLRNLKRNWSED